jgi:glycosyltransferase involved in cell wall biosynthesis
VVAIQVGSFDKGGLEEVVLTLARNLQRSGSVGVLVLVADGAIGHLGQRAQQAGIQVVPLHRNPLLLRRILRSLRVDVVSLHYSTFGAREYAEAGVPMVYTVHNTYVWADAGFARERAEAYAQVARFIAVSEPAASFFAARLGIDPARIQVVPNGLDPELLGTERRLERSAFGLAAGDVVFLNAASFNWNKFHVLMVAALERVLRRYPNAKLVLVGNTHDRACREEVEAQVQARGLGARVRILEYVPKDELIGLMRLSDCFLLPSLIEGWSIAVLEAMHSGLPLILSDVGSARTVIEGGDIGIVVPNPFPDIRELTTEAILRDYTLAPKLDNLDALVAAMESVASDPPGWKRRAAAGRAKVLERYTAARMCDAYLACFAQAWSERGRR